MYLSHFSLNERPFSISPDPRFLFMSNRYREALAHLTYGVEDGGGFVLLTGEVGTGKTTVCRCLLQQLPEKTRLAFVLNPKLNSVELLATICDELNVEYPEGCTSLKILTDKLSEYLLQCFEQELSVVVMIDEAQNIDTEVLEQIRLLTNLETNQKKLLQIILVGQPELQEKLAKRELRQLAQRITARYHLRPLNLKETMAYILHRVRIAGSKKSLFSRQAIELLHSKTAGIPRLINTICDRALVAASSRNKNQVDTKLMQEAIADVMGGEKHPDSIVKTSTLSWPAKSALVIGATLLLASAFWLGQRSSTETSMSVSLSPEISKTSPVKDISEDNAPAISRVSGSQADKRSGVVQESSLVERLLGNERWDNNGLWSMQQLLQQWQIAYSPLNDGNGCDFAAKYGLQCEVTKGNWQQMRVLNRPALLKFSAGLQGDFWGVITSLSGFDATLKFGEREVVVKLDELSTIWTGEYKLLWQSPIEYRSGLKSGDSGPAVQWLSEKMKLLVAPELDVSDSFNQALFNAVSRYQQQRNISADGIAGMQTILMINSETLEGIPLLQKR